MNANNYLETLHLGEYGDRLTDYRGSGMTISDAISEIADGATSIYYTDILDFIIREPDYINKAVREFGWPGDIYKAAQQGEFLYIEEDLLDNFADVMKWIAFEYVVEDLEMEATEHMIDIIESAAEQIDTGSRLNRINEIIDEMLEEEAA